MGSVKSVVLAGQARNRLPFAGALRALATLSVVVYHVALLAGGYGYARKVDLPTWFLILGPAGVGCFFALSGFLLSRPYARAFVRKERLPDWPAYARDRFLRIYPLYAFLVVAIWLAQPWLHAFGGRPATFGDALAHVAFVFPFTPFRSAIRMDPPMWTMATDVQFYLLLPLVCAGVADLFKPSRRVLGYTVAVVALVALSLLWRAGATAYVQDVWNHPEDRVLILWQLPGMFTAFGLGMLGALVWERARDDQRRIGGYIALAISAPFLLIASRIAAADTAAFLVWQEVLTEVGAAALLFAGCALLQAPWIENPAVRWAERLSYAIYLTHNYIIYAVLNFTAQLQGWSFFYATTAATLVVAVAIALPLYLGVERPFLQLKERLRANPRLAGAGR